MNKLCIAFVVLLAGCSTTAANTTAATIETSSQVAMSSAIGYMNLPVCSETVRELCGTKEVASKVNDAQLALEASMKAYRAALVAYKQSGSQRDAEKVSGALSALNTAYESLKSILALASVQEALGA